MEMSLFDLLSKQSFKSEYLEHLNTVRPSDTLPDSMNRYIYSHEFEEDISALQKGTYSFSIPKSLDLFFKSSWKTRRSWSFPERDTNLQRIVAFALHKYDHRFSYSIQLGLKTTTRWETVLRRVKNYDKLYYFKTDISKCSDSINRQLLLEKLDNFIDDDPKLLKFLKDFVQDSRCEKNDSPHFNRCAVSAGSPLSQFLINLYLRELDFRIEPKADFYTRFTDDIVIGCFDPEKLKELEKAVREILAHQCLQTNEDKTFFLSPGEPFYFFDKCVVGKEIDFSPFGLSLMKRSFRKKATELKRTLYGMKPNMKAFMCIYSFETFSMQRYLLKSFPTITTDRSYKVLDHYIQNLMREIITGKSGSGKYTCTYKMLQDCGYRSLTGRYYKFQHD